MTKKAVASSPTMTAGSRSSRAAEILALATHVQATNWLAVLQPDARDLLVEIRDKWRGERHLTGVSAASLARAIIAQMPEHRFPRPKGLAEWLTRSGEQ